LKSLDSKDLNESKLNKMANYKCECGDHEVECSSVVIKVVDGKAIHDVRCPCGKYMTTPKKKRNYTKDGVASLGRMNKSGSSY